ncbi:MAG: M16 family metallopeptidase [Christensenellales bacterium]|nr:pitrilysin family protein [bacterium]
MVFRDKLENGIRVIGEPMPHYRSVSMGVWVDAGSVCENEAEAGASHFIEHMLFKGTERRTAAEIAAEMDAIGGNLNAFTAKECTCFYAKVLDEHLPRAADMLADLLRNSKFDEADIEREKGVVCEEILMTEDSPEDMAHETLCALLYENTPLAKPILGTQESVRSFTRETLMDYMGRHYMPNNIVISCAGHFEREALMDALNRYFAGGGMGERSPRKVSTLSGGHRFRAVEKDIEQVHLCLGFPGFALDEDGQYALFVLNNALGGSMSSRLFQSIREARGLAYSVYSYPSSYTETGYFALYAGTGEGTAEQVTALILEELEKLRKNGLTKEEFIRSKEQLKGSYMLGQESTSARSNAIGKMELLRGRVYSEEEIMQRIERITMDDVQAILPKVLDANAMCASAVGRVENIAEKLQKMLQPGKA